VIMLTRLNGAAFVLNPDLIERIESTPDTVITLVDGKHYMVQEPLDVVVERVQRDRASLLAQVGLLAPVAPESPRPTGPEDGSVIPMRRNH
jgi:flagellar protein FlbD